MGPTDDDRRCFDREIGIVCTYIAITHIKIETVSGAGYAYLEASNIP